MTHHLANVQVIVNKILYLIFNYKTSQIDVQVINATTMKFKIPDLSICNHVRRSMWSLEHYEIKLIPMVVLQWCPSLTHFSPNPYSLISKTFHKSFSRKKGIGFMASTTTLISEIQTCLYCC